MCIYIYIERERYVYIRIFAVHIFGYDCISVFGYAFYSDISIVAIFYPFSQFCEIDIPLLSLQKQPNTAPNLFQRGVEYGKYHFRLPYITNVRYVSIVTIVHITNLRYVSI